MWRRPVSLVNARVVTGAGTAGALRFGSRVLSIDDAPRQGDLIVDLDGAYVLPGLINAHDHLELNHYGRRKGRERYDSAAEWIGDMSPRLRADPALVAGAAHPLADRLFIGALKNILSGVTCVAHHNPFYREIRRACPVRVVHRYGWAHSFHLMHRPAGARGEPGGDLAARFRATPADAPFVVHLAEGVDEDARRELSRFEALGCLQANAVLVHATGIDEDGWARIVRSGAGVVWCPSSSVFLFGPGRERVWRARVAAAPRTVALGTDSRLTGARDLLDELRFAQASAGIPSDDLLRMVTAVPAALLRLGNGGRLVEGGPADFIVVPPGGSAATALLRADRRHLRLVVIDGVPCVAHPALAPIFGARGVRTGPLIVDGDARLADARLSNRIARCPIAEPGVEAA